MSETAYRPSKTGNFITDWWRGLTGRARVRLCQGVSKRLRKWDLVLAHAGMRWRGILLDACTHHSSQSKFTRIIRTFYGVAREHVFVMFQNDAAPAEIREIITDMRLPSTTYSLSRKGSDHAVLPLRRIHTACHKSNTKGIIHTKSH